ncbi:signal peptidase subunit protein [Rutstroemia sp. NJR-2017a WRK4]|nr:signal peptidase subunit protein [Rutstroemia sp. NJR-2017a WRK4]
MHSSLVRLQNVFGFFTSVMFVVAALIACTDVIAPRTPAAEVVVKDIQVVKGRPHYYSTRKEEYAHIRFSLTADLSSLFNWNTKQVFVYVSASWPSNSSTPEIRDNEAVIWDTIITNPSADHLQNIGPAAMKKLTRELKGRGVDRKRLFFSISFLFLGGWFGEDWFLKFWGDVYANVMQYRGILKLKNQKAKYQITQPGGKLAETEGVVLNVHYNVQPWVGLLTWTPQMEFGRWKTVKGGVSRVFRLPALKAKKNEGEKV